MYAVPIGKFAGTMSALEDEPSVFTRTEVAVDCVACEAMMTEYVRPAVYSRSHDAFGLEIVNESPCSTTFGDAERGSGKHRTGEQHRVTQNIAMASAVT